MNPTARKPVRRHMESIRLPGGHRLSWSRKLVRNGANVILLELCDNYSLDGRRIDRTEGERLRAGR